MQDAWQGSQPGADPDPRTDRRTGVRPPEQRVPGQPTGEARMPEARMQEPRIHEARMNPADPRSYGQQPGGRYPDFRNSDSRTPDLRNSDPRNLDPRPAGARQAEAYPGDPQPAGARNPDPRSADPRFRDARLQDLGQRVQSFGAPVPSADAGYRDTSYAQAEYGNPGYRGGPLPAGQPNSGYVPGGGYPPTYPYSPQSGSQAGSAPVGAPMPGGQAGSRNGEFATGYAYGIPADAPAPPAAEPMAAEAEDAAAQDRPQLPASTEDAAASLKGGFQRVAQALRAAVPLVQKLLPLLDGNLATTVSALLVPTQSAAHPPAAPAAPVDLEPVERGLTELRTSHRELRTQVGEQGTTLKRVEDQLERVREATDRNTLEQQELVEDVRAVGTRVSRFIVVGVILLAISVGLNIYLLLQIQHIFR